MTGVENLSASDSSPNARSSNVTSDEARAYALQAIAPQAFGKYTIIGKLGHGGMADVNLAVVGGKGGFRKLVVIKRLHSHLEVEPEFVSMFLDEARLAARLDHPHCVQTHEVGEVDHQHFLAMEYLDGQGFERLLRVTGSRGETLPLPIALRIVADCVDGLAYAHELADYDGRPLGIVHRDVSPQNIFVTYAGVVKLLDFGIAKAETNVVETRTGVVKGKYAYIAPEQALGGHVDQRADLWSVGVVLWEALTARRLFKSVNELATLQETLRAEVKPPSTHNPNIPPELDRICLKLLQREIRDRYQTAAELKDDLERFLRTLPEQPTRKTIANWMREHFQEVIKVHKEKLNACLETVARDPSSIQRLVDGGAMHSGQFAVSSASMETSAVSHTGLGPPVLPASSTGATPSISGVHMSALGSSPGSNPGSNPGSYPSNPGFGIPGQSVAGMPAQEPPRKSYALHILIGAVVILLAVILALVIPRGEDPTAGVATITPLGAGVGSTGADTTGAGSTGSTGAGSTGAGSTGAGSTGAGSTGSTGAGATGAGSTGAAGADTTGSTGATGVAAMGTDTAAGTSTGTGVADGTTSAGTSDPVAHAREGGRRSGGRGSSSTSSAQTTATTQATTTTTTTQATTTPPPQTPPPQTTTTTTTTTSTSTPERSEETGFLTLVTSPWTHVALDGRAIGETPLLRARVPAGRHTLRLTNPDEGIDETYDIEVQPGETVTRRLGLR